MKKLAALFLVMYVVAIAVSLSASAVKSVSGDQQELRVVGYVLGNMESPERMATFDVGHLDHLTDVILFDVTADNDKVRHPPARNSS